uniref:Uncharacterized protein n=1 Tax=Sus scrofa TaxID=9823 RepID=A0A8D1WVF1_PIG
RSSFSICSKGGLEVLSTLSFCLSVKVVISPSNLNESLAGESNLGWRFFPFITLSIACHSLLACRVSAEKSANNLIGVPLFVITFFSLAAFKIFSLSLILVSLINVCLGVCLLGLFYMGLAVLPGFKWVFLSHVREVLSYYLIEYFFCPLLSVSGTPIIWMLVCLTLSQRSLRLSSSVFNLFSLFSSSFVISISLSYTSLSHSSASCILLPAASNEFFTSVIVFCISSC